LGIAAFSAEIIAPDRRLIGRTLVGKSRNLDQISGEVIGCFAVSEIGNSTKFSETEKMKLPAIRCVPQNTTSSAAIFVWL
jgi:hypothetical protein